MQEKREHNLTQFFLQQQNLKPLNESDHIPLFFIRAAI